MKHLNFVCSRRAILLPAVLAGVVFLLPGCDDDTPPVINEEELITTLIVTFTDQASSSAYVFLASDNNGDGTVDEVFTDTLPAGAEFTVNVRFRNDIENEEITEEVAEEAEEHLVCIEETGLDLAFGQPDVDGNGDPLGLEMTAISGVAGTGSFRVQLRHEPDKSAVDPCITGEADVDFTFTGVVLE